MAGWSTGLGGCQPRRKAQGAKDSSDEDLGFTVPQLQQTADSMVAAVRASEDAAAELLAEVR